jgi:hypothetical protein
VEKLCVWLTAIFAASSCLASEEALQIAIEIFDENTQTTVCTYRSRGGEYWVLKRDGRYFCPRVIDHGADLEEPSADVPDPAVLMAEQR